MLFWIVMSMMIAGGLLIFQSYGTLKVAHARVHVSTRQKALSQELGRYVVTLNLDINTSEERWQELDLRNGKWAHSQKALVNGNEELELTGSVSEEAQMLLSKSAEHFAFIHAEILDFVKTKEKFTSEELKALDLSVSNYVEAMNNVIAQFLIEEDSATLIYKYIALAFFILAVIISFVLYQFFMKPNLKLGEQIEREKENLLEQLQESKGTKTSFLANMSHEIRTPLNGVIGAADLIYKTNLSDDQRSYVRTIQGSALNLLEVVNDILDYSKLESGKLEIVKERFLLTDSIDQIIDRLKPYSNEKKLELMSDIDPAIPQDLIHDERRLKQILFNLVNNAIKFTERGEILIKVELIHREFDFVHLKFSIKDTGIGMDKEVSERLFDAFEQADGSMSRQHTGAGLGLAISKGLAQELGGHIGVESTLGRGSTFFFTIVAETSGDSHVAKIAALSGLKALVVDDNKTNLKILVKQLSVWGVQATPFNSPELVPEVVSSGSKFDFCIMDMQMPEMDGGMLASKIREKFDMHQLPIIVLSSVGQHLVDSSGKLYNAYLTKPVRQAKLLDTIIEVLKLNPKTDGTQQMRANTEVGIPQQKCNVLLAYNNEFMRAVAAKTIELLGHQAEFVESGTQIIELNRKKAYDMIILEKDLKDLDGIETVRRLKRMSAKEDLPVIIGLASNEERKTYLQAGMDDVVNKELNPAELQDKILFWFEEEEES